MKNSILKVLLTGITLLILLSGQLIAQTITLGDISSDLEKYENTEYDFIGEDITYEKVDKDKYDDIFKESAIIYAMIEQTSQTLDKINEDSTIVNAGYTIDFISFAASDLPDLKERGEELLNKAKSLNPKDDFSGFRNKMKIPKAAKQLTTSTDRLTGSIDRIVLIIADVTEISKKITQ